MASSDHNRKWHNAWLFCKLSPLFLPLHKICSHMRVKGVQQVKSLCNDPIWGPVLDIDEILIWDKSLFWPPSSIRCCISLATEEARRQCCSSLKQKRRWVVDLANAGPALLLLLDCCGSAPVWGTVTASACLSVALGSQLTFTYLTVSFSFS